MAIHVRIQQGLCTLVVELNHSCKENSRHPVLTTVSGTCMYTYVKLFTVAALGYGTSVRRCGQVSGCLENFMYTHSCTCKYAYVRTQHIRIYTF